MMGISKSIPIINLYNSNALAVANYSYWEQSSFLGKTDVVVIGSGIVGLSAALHLKTLQPTLNVIVLERGFLPTGASTKNAGFACFGTVSEQFTYIEQSSPQETANLVAYKWRGLTRLREKLGDTNIDYQQHGGYELFTANEAQEGEYCIDRLEEINQLLQETTGLPDIYAVADAKIAGFGFKSVSRMIVNQYEGQLHTGKMMRTLLAKVQNTGVLLLNNCEVEQVVTTGASVDIITKQGNFKCDKAILATNAFAKQLFPDLDVTPGRGQVLVTKPVNNLKLKGTYHFNDGYYYFRNIGNRVLFGGGRNLDFMAEQTWEFGHTEAIKQQLLYYLQELILPGQHFEVDYWWSGIMGFGEQIKPIIKQIEPGIFCAVRCNGMGVAMGTLVGEEVAELILNGGITSINH